MTLRDRLLQRLDELLELDRKATPGPWKQEPPHGEGIFVSGSDAIQSVVCQIRTYPDDAVEWMANFALIVKARTYGPAAWRALRAEAYAHKTHPEVDGFCVCERADPCPTLRRIASEILEKRE